MRKLDQFKLQISRRQRLSEMKCLMVLLCIAVASVSNHARSHEEREGYQEDPFNDMRAFQDANRVVSKDSVTLLQRPVERLVSELVRGF